MQPPAELNVKPPCHCPGEKRIVLIGATVRAAAQSAHRAGFCVTGIDLFGDTDTRQVCHRHFVIDSENPPEHIAQACKGVRVVPVGGLNSRDLLIERLAGLIPSLGPSLSAGDQLRDIVSLRELAANSGMRFPPTLDASSQSSGDLGEDRGRWLCKQPSSCGGLGVRWHDDAQGVSKDQLVQKWIGGRSFGATLLSDGSTVGLLGVCRSLFTRHRQRPVHFGSCTEVRPFVYAGSMGPVQISPATSRSLRRLGERIAASTKLRGLFNVDYVLDRSGRAWLLEINPRWSGSSELIERWLIDQRQLGERESLFALSIQTLDGVSSLPTWGTSTKCSWVYLKRVVFSSVDMRFDRKRFTKLIGPNESLHDIPIDGTVIRQWEPVFTLITKINHNAIDPMDRHRVLLRDIRTAIKNCAVEDYGSPRSSAKE